MNENFCIYSVIKNERPHLEEWIAYHKNAGFDNIILIEDINSDSHADIAEKYGVTLFHIEDIMPQEQYEHSYKQRYAIDWMTEKYGIEHGFDWAILIDIDEFLVFEISVPEFCERFKDCNAVHLFWRCYNANGHYLMETGKTQQELYKCDSAVIISKPTLCCKFAVNLHNNNGKMMSIHYYKGGYDVEGKIFKPSTNDAIHHTAYIDHFIFRSYEDWVYKLNRRKNLNARKTDRTFWQFNPDMSKQIAIEQYGLIAPIVTWEPKH